MKRVSCDNLFVVGVLVGVLMVLQAVHVAEAACNPTDLAPCLPAVTTPADPSGLCCKNLRNQKPCLCGYLKDPSYSHLIRDPHVAEKFSRVCGVSIPKCSSSFVVHRQT